MKGADLVSVNGILAVSVVYFPGQRRLANADAPTSAEYSTRRDTTLCETPKIRRTVIGIVGRVATT